MLKLSAIALLSAAALLHVTDAKAEQTELQMATQACENYLMAEHLPIVDQLWPLQKKLGNAGRIIYDQEYGSTRDNAINTCANILTDRHAKNPSKEVWMAPADVADFLPGLIKDLKVSAKETKQRFQQYAGQQVAAEAVRQEQQAKQTKQVQAFSIAEVRQDPILVSQRSECENESRTRYVIDNMREEVKAYQADVQYYMNAYVQSGMTYSQANAQQEVKDARQNLQYYIQNETARVQKLVNRCTIENFGWKQI